MYTPTFTITPEINTRVAEIERLRSQVTQASILPELAVQMRFRASVEAVHSSTSIEGNPLTRLQVQRVLQGEAITAPDYAIREVLNYKRALDWTTNHKIVADTLSSQDILQLHKLLTTKLLPQEKSGHWRSGDVYVVDEINGTEIIRYTGPEATRVPKLVESLLKWIPLQIKSSLHPVLLAGLVHLIFVSIHPFADGNGRTTRLLTYQYLNFWGYDFRGSLSLDSYYLQHQTQYYTALSLGADFDERMRVDVTPFLDFFTKGFLATVQLLTQYIAIGRPTRDAAQLVRLSPEELSLLDYAYQFGSITVQEAMSILKLSKRSVQRRLLSLVEKDILCVEGAGPASRYVMTTNLRHKGN